MDAVRKVYRQLPEVLKMPKELQNQRVEVILLPLGALPRKRHGFKPTPTQLASFAGGWQGEPLVREAQGEYEEREELL